MSATGSVSSMSTFRSGLSTLLWLRRVTEPLPISPVHANLTPSFVASMATGTCQCCQKEKDRCRENRYIPDSESAIRSRQIF